MFVLDVDVVPSKGTRSVLLILRSSSFSVSWFPGACGVVGVGIGARRRSIAPWVCCCLSTPYVPHRRPRSSGWSYPQGSGLSSIVGVGER